MEKEIQVYENSPGYYLSDLKSAYSKEGAHFKIKLNEGEPILITIDWKTLRKLMIEGLNYMNRESNSPWS